MKVHGNNNLLKVIYYAILTLKPEEPNEQIHGGLLKSSAPHIICNYSPLDNA